ncbi:LD-carboxypeptidase [Candidatus Woesearchaeota archaeon]|jgi:muramoyltetrapeptide carboxypeptidase LdcA involved in peptidoglycan recycling|nr:LD-carboxypeptidase [Candidatus Woesearchaeota archaeon]MBT5740643.1 LD-carboxypeptidase [Candidatus Woesearchaeota archaeon]MBT6402493.1 LD-carboxypeptidase [Candidatus Woesearchaeota archaeon]
MIKSVKLKPGDTVAIVSPSWGGPSVFPNVYESGIKTLESLGLRIKEYPSARKEADYLYKNPKFRAKDINDAFADPEVKALFTTIGGDDSIRILPFLDVELIKRNPKTIIGYSDTTILNSYLNQLGLVTLNGPAIMAGFSQWNSLGSEFQKHIRGVLFDNPEDNFYLPFPTYCEGYTDWSVPANVGKTKEMQTNNGWNWLQGDTVVEGELFGGCVEVFEMMKGTDYWPSKDFWEGKVFFLETSEEKPTPDSFKYMLRNYGIMGIFDRISALLIGRPRDYSDKEKQELDENVLKLVREEFQNSSLPIVSNMDFGHTDPQWILPLGIRARLDCKKKTFGLVEKIFND